MVELDRAAARRIAAGLHDQGLLRIEGGSLSGKVSSSPNEKPARTRFEARPRALTSAQLEERFGPLRAAFASYVPGSEVVVAEFKHPLSPQFAYTLRKVFGGTAPDETPLYGLAKVPEVNESFETRQKQALGKALNAVKRAGIETVGDLRHATERQLAQEVNGISDEGRIFVLTAFRKFIPSE